MSSTSLTIGFLRRGYSSTGGVESYLKGLARGLLEQGHRPILFGTHAWPVEEWPGGEILRCNGKGLSRYAAEVERHKKTSGINLDLTLSVEKVAGCDIYRTDEGVHAAWLDQRAPHITPWARFFQRINPKHREKLRLEKALYKPDATRRVISLSHKITGEIRKYYGYPADCISLIRNGAPSLSAITAGLRTSVREELGITSEQKIVLFVGTGWERKGLRFAIRAVEQLNDPNVLLLVAGKGIQSRYSSPVVRFLGAVREIERIYASADLLVAPSLYEPFSLVALEALGAGLPVVTSKIAGVSEIMTQGVHGEIIENPSDVVSLSAAIRRVFAMLEAPERATASRAECVALASQFSLKRNLGETLMVIDEVIQEKRKRGERG